MKTFSLKYREVITEDFEIKPLNLMLTFQVNCPGCFIHGIPLMQQMMNKFYDHVGFSLLSTAFEDFQQNTLDNTRSLVTQGKIIGETKKALTQYGYSHYFLPRHLPVLYDEIQKPQDMVTDELIVHLCRTVNPVYDNESESEKKAFEEKIYTQYVDHYSAVGYTFFTNVMQGTPTFILFNEELQVMNQWFGQKDPQQVEQLLKERIS